MTAPTHETRPPSAPEGSAQPAGESANTESRQARRKTGSKFLAVLDTFEHVTDNEQRTDQVLRLMPWIFACVLIVCGAGVVGITVITAHVHAAQVAKSVTVRWAAGITVGSSGLAALAMKARAALKLCLPIMPSVQFRRLVGTRG